MPWVTVYALALPVLVTGLAWALRRQMSHMTAMVLAMSLGTAAGLWAGSAAVVLGLGDLWDAALLGAGVGAGFGIGAGLSGGLSPTLDGGLGGVMGGMMGAMLAAMAPGRATAALRASTALLSAVAVLVVLLLVREAGAHEVRSAVRSRWLLLALVVVAGLILGAAMGVI
ncbi:hypothetical protein [Caldinitratiruptor microaerophilus]|uniref:Uncharacterized protein n=1 Tax=Caldinitratiruptor microaerophilus TaxID=671077 RepID=A0AA35CHF8_9FIRM|nr:hypothetical protein [Caldinitratiruptor microaerophilus]BDG58912.1 hypothetical protein caldi_00020 [Caldinitratiruptor microaerophilus]